MPRIKPDEVPADEVPALVYLCAEGWASRRSILVPMAERVKRPYHAVNYDKRQLIASAFTALFVELIQSGMVGFELDEDEVMINSDAKWSEDPTNIYNRVMTSLADGECSPVDKIVANLLDHDIPYVWDAYDKMLAAEVSKLGYVDESGTRVRQFRLPGLKSQKPSDGSALSEAERLCKTVRVHVDNFRKEDPIVFKTLWGDISRGIASREAGVASSHLFHFSLEDIFISESG